MASRIEDYGMIGNTRTVALVSRDGNVEWACFPRFDSDACFTALIGTEEHGVWRIAPTSTVRARRWRYRPDTLILETEIECDGGRVRVTDFMPQREDRSDVVRIVEGLEGEVAMELLLAPRFGYGESKPLVAPEFDGVRLSAGPDALILRTSVDLELSETDVRARFKVRRGERRAFVLSWYPSHLPPPSAVRPDIALRDTDQFWNEWVSHCTHHGPYRDAVVRSLITLKALTYSPTGGIVAAPTASLPEEIGGVRNWDYRFCWLRDAALTLTSLLTGGYREEASQWRDWLIRAASGDPAQIQIMYGIAGERRLTELELPWLPGYEGSRPVRVGNAAHEQFQLDVYGEAVGCIYLARRSGVGAAPANWLTGRRLIEFVESVWQKPDDGIWEVRGAGRSHFTYSKVMAWVALDRATRIMDEFGAMLDPDEKKNNALKEHWRKIAKQIHSEVCEKGFNAKKNAFTQSYGSEALDASVLVMPHLGFLSATDPRIVGTVAAIERELLRDGFVRRYATETNVDGLPGDEGAFLACSFWLADNYAMAGRLEEAENYFDRLLAIRNDLGLLAEEYEPRLHRMIGNFPQAFSHVGLVNTAHLITSRRAALTRGEQAAPSATNPELWPLHQ